jgi:hypothetical protein
MHINIYIYIYMSAWKYEHLYYTCSECTYEYGHIFTDMQCVHTQSIRLDSYIRNLPVLHTKYLYSYMSYI